MWRRQCIEFLRKTFPNEESDVELYISEAEHGDGYGYWHQFDEFEELATDFRLFVENTNE